MAYQNHSGATERFREPLGVQLWVFREHPGVAVVGIFVSLKGVQ